MVLESRGCTGTAEGLAVVDRGWGSRIDSAVAAAVVVEVYLDSDWGLVPMKKTVRVNLEGLAVRHSAVLGLPVVVVAVVAAAVP